LFKYEKVSLSKLKLYDKNPRRNDEAVDLVVKSIEEYGFINPIVVDKCYNVCAGHTRIKAAVKLGMTEVPVLVTDLKGNQFKGYNIADNSTGQKANWDPEGLADIVSTLKVENFNMESLGFDSKMIDSILLASEENKARKDINKGQETTTEDPPPRTQLGDLYQLGDHRLLCGKSPDDLDKLINGQKVNMVISDPPYGINLGCDFSSQKGTVTMLNNSNRKSPTFDPVVNIGSLNERGNTYRQVLNDDKDFDAKPFLDYFKNVDSIFLFGADYYLPTIPNYKDGSIMVWDKRETDDVYSSTSLGKGFTGSHFELLWSKHKHQRRIFRITWNGMFGRGPLDLPTVHPTQKPVRLLQTLMTLYGKENDLIVDGYGGSGSTLIAAERSNRKCYIMELDPHYCDVIINRWEKLTGKTAQKVTETTEVKDEKHV